MKIQIVSIIAFIALNANAAGNSCFEAYQKDGRNLSDSAVRCRGGVGDACFEAYRKDGRNLSDSAVSCRDLIKF
jgi:hypothetical protein